LVRGGELTPGNSAATARLRALNDPLHID